MCGCGKNSVCECERIMCVCVGVLDMWEWLNSLCGRILYIGVGESHVCVWVNENSVFVCNSTLCVCVGAFHVVWENSMCECE